MNVKHVYRRLDSRFERMDPDKQKKLLIMSAIGASAVLVVIALVVIFSLRHLNVIVGVDTAGLLGRPAVLLRNMSSSELDDVYIKMDDRYTTEVKEVDPRKSIVVYFSSFRPLPPAGYRPSKVSVTSGFAEINKSIPPFPR